MILHVAQIEPKVLFYGYVLRTKSMKVKLLKKSSDMEEKVVFSRPQSPILIYSKINPVYIFPTHFYKVHFNIILGVNV